MQKANTHILDFFKSQPARISCPACGTSLPKSKLNEHLDSVCSSTPPSIVPSESVVADKNLNVPVGKSHSSSAPKRKILTKSSRSNRLSLKIQRNKKSENTLEQCYEESEIVEDDEIIVLKEIHTSSEKLSFSQKPKSVGDCVENSSAPLKESLLENEAILPCAISIGNETSKIPNRMTLKRHVAPSTISSPKLVINCNGNEDCLSSDNMPSKRKKARSHDSDSHNISSDIACLLNDAKQVLEDESVFSELSDSNEKEEERKDAKSYTPYYIANFRHILETVLNEEDNKTLFNDEDIKSIEAFKASSESAQKLYVRLFQRKYKWLRVNKINYPDITKDPFMILEELVRVGLVDSGTSEIELETALELLSLPEAKNLAKHFNFNSGKNKSEIKQMLLKHCKEHKSVFFTKGSNGVSGMMLKKVKQMMGPCYRISLLPKRLFTRVLMLFSLPTISEDDDEAAGGQQQQLLTLLQVNKGELVFPVCRRNKETVIFCDRDELVRYEEARQLENDIFNAVESKNFELAKDLYINAKNEFEVQCSCNFANRASSLPAFLKRYTSFHVYIRCMTQGVEALQKLRQYDEAVSLLRKLLKQKIYCQDYKGRWYDRLALNLEQHLKKPQKALEAIKRGLKDQNVRVGHRYSLLTRALRITKSLDENDELRKQILEEAAVKEAPKVIIKGRLCPRPILGRRHVFISSSAAVDEDDITVLGVEELALEHYREEGFSEGIHGEGSTFISLYALLFWDIIYDDNIPDVFISPHQTHPLDLNSEAFFPSREDQIMSHLETLRQATTDELKEIVKTTWESHHGKASLVSWDRFTDLEHVKGLVSSFGNSILCGICERLARDFRFTRSGVPDLVVWNPEALHVKIVEVKGPGDKLSSKQILWLDYLIKLGADAEVCLVEAVASKKLRK